MSDYVAIVSEIGEFVISARSITEAAETVSDSYPDEAILEIRRVLPRTVKPTHICPACGAGHWSSGQAPICYGSTLHTPTLTKPSKGRSE